MKRIEPIEFRGQAADLYEFATLKKFVQMGCLHPFQFKKWIRIIREIRSLNKEKQIINNQILKEMKKLVSILILCLACFGGLKAQNYWEFIDHSSTLLGVAPSGSIFFHQGNSGIARMAYPNGACPIVIGDRFLLPLQPALLQRQSGRENLPFQRWPECRHVL